MKQSSLVAMAFGLGAIALASCGISAQESVIYSFLHNGTDGFTPTGGVVMDKNGNLYGVTNQGGPNMNGVAYELSPPAQAGGDWTETILYNFGDNLAAGYNPGAGGEGGSIILDASGNIYGIAGGGTSPASGGTASGVAYELSPPSSGSGEWSAQAIYTFLHDTSQPTLLYNPQGAVVFDKNGNLYGVATLGGANGVGGVFELSPPAQSGNEWTMTPLYSFNNTIGAGEPWGPTPNASLIVDAKGNLYGTTEYGGVSDAGTVYELSPPAAGGNGTWTPAILYSFRAVSIFDASNPYGSLIFDAQGNLYGTTFSGGTNSGGTVFELSPPASAGGKWTETLLNNFTAYSATDGFDASANVLFDQQGNLWGATFHGGPYYTQVSVNTDGAIFELMPQGGGKWAEASPMPYFFGSQTNDAILPNAQIIMDGKGNIYSTGGGGATACNSSEQCGAVWEYTPPAPAAAPTFNPPAGTYTAAQSVEIGDSISGATIYYTTDGTAPTTKSTEYSSAIEVAASETLSAIAVATGYAQSSVATAAYVIETPAATPVISPAAGIYPAAVTVKITDATAGASIFYTTNGTTPTTASKKYTAEFKVTDNQTIKAIASAPEYTPSKVASAVYTVRTATPVFSVKAGKYPKAQSVKITDTTLDAVIYYTVNGATPTATAKKYTGAIAVAANETIKAIAIAKGYANSLVGEAAYTIEAAAPVIKPDGGTFNKSTSVTMTDATPGATIYYTTTGKAPTEESTKYTKAITVSKSETVEAIAIGPKNAQSPVTIAKFTVE